MEEARGDEFEKGLAVSAATLTVDDVSSFPPAVNHLRDDFGGILQVCIKNHRGIAARFREADRHRGLLAEVAGEFNDRDMWVLRGDRLKFQQRAVSAPVVDVDHLVVHASCWQQLAEPAMCGLDDLCLVVAGNHD